MTSSSSLLAALVGSCLLALAAPAECVASGARQQAVLDLVLNGEDKGEIMVVLRDGAPWAEVSALERAGMRVIGGRREQIGQDEFVELASLGSDLRVTLDEAALALRLVAPARLLGHLVIDIGDRRPTGVEHRRANSGFVNYGVSWSPGGTRSLNLESGVSLGAALATGTLFLAGGGAPLRGMTSLVFDDRARLNRFVVGDAVAYTGPLGGSLQLAGVAVSRDFSIDPYFVRYPTAGLSGAVLTPSRLEVYVNDQLVTSTTIAPGTYELSRVPLQTGAGTARVVLRDAFGGEQEISQGFYIGAGALARGVHQFQYAVGSERLRPFDDNWSYGRVALLGSHRFGLTDAFTIGGRIEAARSLVSGGPLLAARLAGAGEIEIAAALSRDGRSTGTAASIAYEYSSATGGMAVAFRRMSSDYATTSTGALASKVHRELLASGSLRAASRVQIRADWRASDYTHDLPAYRNGSITTTILLTPRWNLFVSSGRARLEHGWQTVAFAGLTAAIGSRTTATASVDTADGRARGGLTVQRGLPAAIGYGYRIRATGGAGPGADGELRMQTQWGLAGVRQQVVDGAISTEFDLAGALVAIGGGLHVTRPVQDGYALVRVPGVRGVRAFVSHQPVGRTGRNGDLLVPNLLSYYGNKVSIADVDIPVDRTIGRTELLLAPGFRGGALAVFDAPREHRIAGKLRLALPAGQRAPANGHLMIETPAGPIELSLGSDGEFYAEGVGPGRYGATVETRDLTCAFTMVVPVSDAPVTRLGTVICSDSLPIPEPNP